MDVALVKAHELGFDESKLKLKEARVNIPLVMQEMLSLSFIGALFFSCRSKTSTSNLLSIIISHHATVRHFLSLPICLRRMWAPCCSSRSVSSISLSVSTRSSFEKASQVHRANHWWSVQLHPWISSLFNTSSNARPQIYPLCVLLGGRGRFDRAISTVTLSERISRLLRIDRTADRYVDDQR